MFEITKELNKSKHVLGGKNPYEGLDCYTNLIYLRSQLGIDTSKLFDGCFGYKEYTLTFNNYHVILKNIDPIEMNNILIKLVREKMKKVNNILIGDVLILEKIKLLFVGIYLGQDNVGLIVQDKGFRVMKLKNLSLLEIYR